MTKRDLVKWLERKQSEAKEKAMEAKDKKITEIKEAFYKELGIDDFVDKVVPIFEKAFAEYKSFYDKVGDIDGVTISKYGYKRGYYDIEALTVKGNVRDSIIEVLHYSDTPTQAKINEVSVECKKVERTYITVIETVKNLPTAKDGIEYLKKLGFDTSEIQPLEQKKQLPATISVNVDVKYLLLNKEKEDAGTSEADSTDR